MSSNFDIIGDVHGQYEKLVQLLHQLGYEAKGDGFSHPANRRVIFLGDYIDRGPRIRDTLLLVRSMIDSGDALAIMGNHEYNAVAYAMPSRQGGFIRPRTDRNTAQHYATLKEFENRPSEWADWLKWMRALPTHLDLGQLRAVHACWSQKDLELLEKESLLDDDFLQRTGVNGSAEKQSLDCVLKGPEIALPNSEIYLDAKGEGRSLMRVRWWNHRPRMTLGEFAMPAPYDIPWVIPNDLHEKLPLYEEHEVPVFFGHYWLPPEFSKRPLASNVVCLDYSGGIKEHPLVAYQFDATDTQLSESKFVIGKKAPK